VQEAASEEFCGKGPPGGGGTLKEIRTRRAETHAILDVRSLSKRAIGAHVPEAAGYQRGGVFSQAASSCASVSGCASGSLRAAEDDPSYAPRSLPATRGAKVPQRCELERLKERALKG
jgi:hypothetical protein